MSTALHRSQTAAAPTRRAAVEAIIARIDLEHEPPAGGLPNEDLARAAMLRDPARRERFLAGRRLLRAALATRHGLGAAAAPIRTGPTGKPFLPDGLPSISLAHSGRWCALALSEDCEVGVDIEQIVERPGLDALAAVFMPAPARDQIAAAQAEHRSEVVLHWWVRLEAAAKACGAPLDHAAALFDAVQFADLQAAGFVAAVAGCGPRPLRVTWIELGR